MDANDGMAEFNNTNHNFKYNIIRDTLDNIMNPYDQEDSESLYNTNSSILTPVTSNGTELMTERDPKSYMQLSEKSTKNIKIKSQYLQQENTPEKVDQLKNLLKSWNLEELYDYFIEEQLYVSVLKCLNKEMACNLLPPNYSKGIQIIFVNNWCKWIENTHFKELGTVSDDAACTSSWNKNNYDTDTENNVQSRVTLLKILNNSVHGKNILEHYKKNGRINNDDVRKLLLDTIVHYYLQEKLELTTLDCENLSNEIVNSFNGETKEYYYSHRKNSCPRGKLYNKFHNKKSFLKKTVADTHDVKLNQQRRENVNCNEQEEQYIRSLKFDNLTIEEVVSHYDKCRNTRLHEIKSSEDMKVVYANWPHYKQSYGYKLISNDFNYLYGCHTKIYEEFDTFFEKLLPVLEEKIKDVDTIKLFTQLNIQKSSLTEDGRNATLLYLLPVILAPTTRSVVKASDGTKRTKRFTIKDSQLSIINIHPTIMAWDSYINHQKEHESSIQPYIGIIGDSIFDPKEIYVYWDNIKFRFYSILRALDVCFMIFFVFNFSYPKQSEAVWQLINKYFYNIKDTGTGVHTSVSLLLHAIKN